MNNDNNQAGVDEHLTRAQYRSKIKHKRGLFGHHQNEETTDKNQQASHGNPEPQPIPEPTPATEQTNAQSAFPNRAASLAMDKETLAEEKSQRLAKRLNIAIAVLVVLIVVVYLVLFFVG